MRGEDGQLYNLQLIQEHDSTPRMQGANNPRRVEYVPSPSRGYAPSHHRVNSLDSNHRSRFATAAPSRRPSEQDVVLPSVEREPERVMYDRVEDRAPLPMGQIPIHREGDRFAPLRPLPAATLSHEDVQSRPRMQAQHYEVVDLTSSSPIRPPQGRDRASYVAPPSIVVHPTNIPRRAHLVLDNMHYPR
ncbi:hypothetical protein K504DRAFT_291778 [Pleomassaria siparia CBS 279.74]|uniref:Uncharacterized protein n=1 Tax=Pleomassaria siparia CBS 279.74 TaxID=1314801 RepID=A0A6G1K985_9PLEO|nr:hypothetical protein K504DRAFT_291778 [Pleomassaria siparia CBS 279.74]